MPSSASSAISPPPVQLPTLLGSLGAIWPRSRLLRGLVPAKRVCTGRIPSTTEYPMPYVSITEAGGHRRHRTNVNRYEVAPIVFHIWVGESQVALGEAIEQAISEVYADGGWRYSAGTVIDVLDEGPAAKNEVTQADYKYWEITKVFTLCIERPRQRRPLRPGSSASGSASSSTSASASSSSSNGSGSPSAGSSTQSSTLS